MRLGIYHPSSEHAQSCSTNPQLLFSYSRNGVSGTGQTLLHGCPNLRSIAAFCLEHGRVLHTEVMVIPAETEDEFRQLCFVTKQLDVTSHKFSLEVAIMIPRKMLQHTFDKSAVVRVPRLLIGCMT